MRIFILIGMFLSLSSLADEVAVTYNPSLDLKQITLPKDFPESELLKNDSLFKDQIADFSNYLSPKSRTDTERIIGIGQVIDVVNRLPANDLNRALLDALKIDLSNTDESCSVAGKALGKEFDPGGLCEEAECALFNEISANMIAVAKEFDDSCGTVLEAADKRLNKTVALFLAGKFLCMGHMKDDLLITARHCFYHDGYVVDVVKNKSLEITVDEYSKIKVPVEISFAYLNDISNTKTLRMLLPDDTGFLGFEDVLAISFSDSTDISFRSPQIPETSNMVVVNRFLVPEQTDLDKAVREYKKPTCRVIAAGESCILHTCPTLPSISGAPLYQPDDNGDNDIIGVHVGAFGEDYYDTCADVSEIFESGFMRPTTSINVAIPVDEETKIQKVHGQRI